MVCMYGIPRRIAERSEAEEGSRSEVRGFRDFEPRTSGRAFRACLALHAPHSVVLADFFSILLGQRRKRSQRYTALMSTDPNMTGNPNLKNCQKEMG